MKYVYLFSFILPVFAFADVWQKPPYRADENHLPHVIYHREAQEENPAHDKKVEKKIKESRKKKEKEKSAK